MTEKPIYPLEEFPKHVASLTPRQWQQVFEFIPETERTEEFGSYGGGRQIAPGFVLASYHTSSGLASSFMRTMYSLSLVINFDWSHWKEGERMIEAKNFKGQDTITLLKLLTAIIRNDRFCEGYLDGKFYDGTVLAILKELKGRVNEEQPSERTDRAR
jgi:hypothetical protein